MVRKPMRRDGRSGVKAGLLRAAVALAGAMPAAAAAQVTPAASRPGSAVDMLVRQAERWLGQERLELAAPAVERALAAEPNNPAVLSVAARLEVARGNRDGANTYLARLRAAGATPEQQSQAEGAVRNATLDRNAIEEARRLAREGRSEAAAQRYRQIFGASGPTDQYALEYYQTLAGTAAGRDEGQTGLARLAARPGSGDRAQLANAQVLTYGAVTRAEGIRRLSELADHPDVGQEARQSWRAALSFGGNDPATLPLLENYLRRFPDDADIRRQANAIRAAPPPAAADPNAASRQAAFARMEAGGIADAARQFQAILAASPNDPDALGGLGVVRLREGNETEARRLLERAVAADPTGGRQWKRALDAASYSTDVAEARAKLRRSDLEGADEAARRAAMRDVDDNSDAEVVLGELALRRGDPAGAEARFRNALSRRPNFSPAGTGLNAALRAQGRPAEASVARAGPTAPRAGGGTVTANATANSYRAEAARVADPAAAAALLRNAVAAAPDDPWTRLDLARALRRQGRGAEGRALMDELASRVTNPDAAYAAALLAEEDGRLPDADAMLSRIPPNRRSPDMSRLASRIRAQREVLSASALLASNPIEGRFRLLALAARPDPAGSTATAVIRAFGNANDRPGAVEAARVATIANRAAGTTARIAIASALLGAGLDAEATALADETEAAGASAEQRRDLAAIRAGAAIRASDRLSEAGDQASAFERLRPVLTNAPDNNEARLALSRLYLGARQPAEALRVSEAVLARDPRNLDARRGAVEAALTMNDRRRAETLLAEAQAANPRDSRVALLEARVARAGGDDTRARRALETAAALRAAELGPAARGSAPAADFSNPFIRPGARPTLVAGAAPADRISREIQTELAAVQNESGTRLAGSFGGRVRSGDPGLDRLAELSATLEAQVSPASLGGRITAAIQPVTIDSDSPSVDVSALRRYGTNALNTNLVGSGAASAASRDTTASGVGLSATYARGDWLRLDVGSTPLGFRNTNIVGGIEVAPRLSDNLRLRMVGERRAVTDSLLSWAGATDDRSAQSWGPVMRTGGRGQVEVPLGAGYLYAGGGYSVFEGDGVASNNRVEAGAGFAYPFVKNESGELTGGLDLVYFGYDRNLRYFTLGHGGYFSPQQYTSLNIPIDYRGRSGDISYRVGATVGYASYREDRAPYFPNNTAMQSQVEALAASSACDPAVVTACYAGQSQSGFVGGLRADLDWALTPALTMGGALRYDKAANFDETRVLLRLMNRF
jgi:predicted Zn-dependent protease